MSDDVRELVQRCLAGDEPAMVALVDRFKGQVFGLCYRMLGNRQDAEDMAQEAFVRALRNLHRWDSSRDFRPWLLAIAGNRCRSLLATRNRRPSSLGLIEDDLPAPSAETDEGRQLQEEVDRALKRLRPEYQQAFLLFHEQELSYAEIGEMLQRPVGTIKTWIHRARHEIARHLLDRGVVEERRHELRGI